MLRAAVLIAALGSAALASGCGGELPPEGPPAFEVEPGQILTSDSGSLTVSVWTSPAPPTKGVNVVRLRVVDGAGAPVEAAEVSAMVWMPAHGHGTSVKPSVTALGDGVYDLSHVVFFMGGRWELRADVNEPPLEGAPIADTFAATFDVR